MKVEPVTEEVTITAPVTIATHIETCPVAPCVQTEDVSETPPSFRFLKTKRVCMHIFSYYNSITPFSIHVDPGHLCYIYWCCLIGYCYLIIQEKKTHLLIVDIKLLDQIPGSVALNLKVDRCMHCYTICVKSESMPN